MPFELAEATLVDIPEIVDVAIDGFDSDPAFHQMKCNCLTSDVAEFCIPGYTRAFETPGVKLFKIVDTENGYLTSNSHLHFTSIDQVVTDKKENRCILQMGLSTHGRVNSAAYTKGSRSSTQRIQ